jgi:tRNA A37 threonylcarbamoyladenosine dehydratase
MRNELRKRGVESLKVVFSKEMPVKQELYNENITATDSDPRRSVPASVAFVPPVAGLIMAGEVIKDLIS